MNYRDAAVDNTANSIVDTIREVFGPNSPQFDRHQYHRIWHGGYNMGDDHYVGQRKFLAGIPQTISMLEGLIAWLEEKQIDLGIKVADFQENRMNDVEIRKQILQILKELFDKNPHMIISRSALLERLKIKPEELDRNIKYLEGKGAIWASWNIGGGFQARIESTGIDLLYEYDASVNGLGSSSQPNSSFAKNKDIFIAYQFSEGDEIKKLKKLIADRGYNWKEGKREDLGSISEDILEKIKNCGFFLAVMTKRDKLKDAENFTTSSWLLEEKGAALAFGHRPLIMVQEGVDSHYIGYLQNDHQRVHFNKSNLDEKITEAIKMIETTYKKRKIPHII